MKNIVGNTGVVIIATCMSFMNFSCNNNAGSENSVKDPVDNIASTKPVTKKQPGNYPDTLIIDFPAAVFYHPDSLQLAGIKARTDSMNFDGSMHEYFYQMRNARIVIKKNWPLLSIIESEKYRYLMFIAKDSSREYIDLDTKNDVHGLFVFDGIKAPVLVDMTNIETILGFYFSK